MYAFFFIRIAESTGQRKRHTIVTNNTNQIHTAHVPALAGVAEMAGFNRSKLMLFFYDLLFFFGAGSKPRKSCSLHRSRFSLAQTGKKSELAVDCKRGTGMPDDNVSMHTPNTFFLICSALPIK